MCRGKGRCSPGSTWQVPVGTGPSWCSSRHVCRPGTVPQVPSPGRGGRHDDGWMGRLERIGENTFVCQDFKTREGDWVYNIIYLSSLDLSLQ